MGKKNKKKNKVEKKVETKVVHEEVKANFFVETFNKVKGFFEGRLWLLILIAVIIVMAIVSIILSTGKKKDKFALNEIYDYAPEEVRKVYSNFVSVGCIGDLNFDIKVDSGEQTLDKINKEVLLNYLFSYLDKNNMLDDKVTTSEIDKAERELFDTNLNLKDSVNEFNYNGYVYNLEAGKIKKEKKECPEVEKQYVLHLYGFYQDRNKLNIDINVSYLKGGMLYTVGDKELGKYDGDVSKLPKLTETTSYYRATFIIEGNNVKLHSIEHKNRS